MRFLDRPLDRPIGTLIKLFICWKLTLLFLALCSPGPGYDTSSNLDPSGYQKEPPLLIDYTVGKLKRWDAIYFTKAANRGYQYEQEWAFGWGFTQAIRFCASFLTGWGVPAYDGLEAFVAIIIAHISHLAAVIVLYQLTLTLFPAKPPNFAFITASLHIISPAGIFLSAPYAESSCALLSFAGCLLFVKSFDANGSPSPDQDMFILDSGVFFGLATTLRSNGILNGLLLLEEAFRGALSLGIRPLVPTVRRVFFTGLGGLCAAFGFILPQYIAYTEYCGDEDTPGRPWCDKALPSIYTFVQHHYWNCGPFQYWTLSNVPLFLLGAPMFTLLTISGLWALRQIPNSPKKASGSKKEVAQLKATSDFGHPQIIRNMAISQLALVLLTLTTAHVQIITRISSAYPVWLWYTASSSQTGNSKLLKGVVSFSVIYAVVQAGLFASFLPPA